MIKYIVGSNGKLIDVKYVGDKIQLPNIFGNFSSEKVLLILLKN